MASIEISEANGERYATRGLLELPILGLYEPGVRPSLSIWLLSAARAVTQRWTFPWNEGNRMVRRVERKGASMKGHSTMIAWSGGAILGALICNDGGIGDALTCIAQGVVLYASVCLFCWLVEKASRG